MRTHLISFWLSILFGGFLVQAQDVDTQYLKLQESYTLRIQEITQRYQKQKRELLNKFILALVRVEQGYRDEGNLDGVMMCRTLRENVLLNPVFPERPPETPPALAEMFDTLYTKKDEVYQLHQQELSNFNLMLLNALPAYQTEFNRQQNVAKAKEVQDLRAAITEAQQREQAISRLTGTIVTNISTNPNDYPFALSAKAYSQIRGMTARNCRFPLTINKVGAVKETNSGFNFVEGRLEIPVNQSGPLVEDIQRNQMITVEMGFQPTFTSQGYETNPVILMLFGTSLASANFAITMEGNTLWLYLKTKVPPADRKNHRYEIGKITNLNHVHIEVTYRIGDLNIYLNGTATLRLRDEVVGTISEWEPAPIFIGRSPPNPEIRFTLPFRGTINHLYMKAGEASSRQVISDYNNYLNFTNP
ncbi:hypothetical protein P3T73_14945 [Kiritimatiellota bacterium B12222]|nr:hypothetical protein P3T73_14945 [Kiritimatiellota bacterium B12222]